MLPLTLLALALVACAWVGCVLDIARAAVVQADEHWRDALMTALTCLRAEPFSVLLGGYPSAAASAFAYLCSVWFMARLDLSTPSAVPIALSFGAHQAATLFAVAWRVRWLRRALELSRASGRQ